MALTLDLTLLDSDRKFGQFCFRLARKEFPDVIPVAFASWDGGRDVLSFNQAKGDIVWQCKFSSRISASPALLREIEDYSVELHGVKTLESVILPDIKGGAARASLRGLRLA